MSRRRLALLLLGTAVAGSQAGHLVAFQLRFGAAAQQLQATGVHAYFPQLAKTAAGAAALTVLAAVALVGVARVATGRRIEKASAPSPVRLMSVLFTAQLAVFAAQETIEAVLGGSHVATAGELLLWGSAGQLPVALVAAFALRWLVARLEPSLQAIGGVVTARQPLIPTVAVQPVALPVRAVAADGRVRRSFSRRGPPSF